MTIPSLPERETHHPPWFAVPPGGEAQGPMRVIDCAGPGITRRRAGKGFTYLDEDGDRVADPEVIDRIRALAIPPAWTDVWICPDPRGHIQATGSDDRGRRQYRYHDEWRDRRDREKYDRMLDMARTLPRLRERLAGDLAGSGLGRDRVLACAVRLLELGLFRVGGEAYAEDNGSYGLATVRKGHVRSVGGQLRFDYPAKGGQRRVVEIRDPDVIDVVRALKRRRRGGPELLAYKDGRGRWVDVRSSDINAYLQEALGAEFSAKDFRTWAATVLAAVALAAEEGEADGVPSEAQRKRAVVRVVKDVAAQLGNTPAVARGSYVDPRVIEEFERGETVGDDVVEAVDDEDALDRVDPEVLAEVESAVVSLIEQGVRRRIG
jgi:DNA topoisomerase I